MASAAPSRAATGATGNGRPVAVKLSDEGVPELVGRLVDDTRGLVSAEVELYKAKVAERVTAYKAAAVLFAIAGVLGLVGLIALLVGLIMTLATLIGPGLATLVVVGVVFAAAAVLGLMGRSKLAPPNTGAPR
jgi:hypothetical protein